MEQVGTQQCDCVEGWSVAAECGTGWWTLQLVLCPCTLAPAVALLYTIVQPIEYSQCLSLKAISEKELKK